MRYLGHPGGKCHTFDTGTSLVPVPKGSEMIWGRNEVTSVVTVKKENHVYKGKRLTRI